MIFSYTYFCQRALKLSSYDWSSDTDNASSVAIEAEEPLKLENKEEIIANVRLNTVKVMDWYLW